MYLYVFVYPVNKEWYIGIDSWLVLQSTSITIARSSCQPPSISFFHDQGTSTVTLQHTEPQTYLRLYTYCYISECVTGGSHWPDRSQLLPPGYLHRTWPWWLHHLILQVHYKWPCCKWSPWLDSLFWGLALEKGLFTLLTQTNMKGSAC